MNGSRALPHLDESALVRALDGEALDGEEAAHLEACDTCRDRLGEIRRRALAFSDLLERARAAEPAPPPDLWERIVTGSRRGRAPAGTGRAAEPAPGPARPSWWRGTLPRAAVVAGLLAAGALAAEPVRRWVGGLIATVVSNDAGERSSGEGVGGGTMPERGPAGTSPPEGVLVGFVPAAPTLRIRLDRPQTGGTIEVRFEDREDATGEVLGEGPGASLLVLPDGFQARNRAGDLWSYRFRLPRTLEVVEVLVAGEPVARIAAGAGADATLELGR